MGVKVEDISNSELYSLHLNLKEEHGKVKQTLIKELNKLESLENDYQKIIVELNKRGNG